MGIGILQVVAQIYVMEICPNRIRGGMIAFQAIWNNIGGILVSLMVSLRYSPNPNHPIEKLNRRSRCNK